MEQFEVYLAGRIANLSYEEAKKYRDDIVDRLTAIGIKCRTPMRGNQYVPNGTKLNGDDELKSQGGFSMQEVIHRDLSDLREVDALIVLTGDDPSWGTAGEFYYCTWYANKPTLVISKHYIGAWMAYYATKVVPDIDSAIEVLKRWKEYWNHKGAGINDKR